VLVISDIEGLGVDVLTKAVAPFRSVTASDELKDLERIRARARHNEAQAIYNAEIRVAKERDEHWQGVVVEKDTALAEKDSALAEKDDHWQGIVAEKDALIAQLRAMAGNNSK